MKRKASNMTKPYSTSLDNMKGEKIWFEIGASVVDVDSAEEVLVVVVSVLVIVVRELVVCEIL